MKRIFIFSVIALLGFSSSILAGGFPVKMKAAPVAVFNKGIYIGIEGGFGQTHWRYRNSDTRTFSKDDGFVARAYLGYDLCKYFALEAGYTYFFDTPEYKGVFSSESVKTDEVNRTHAVDIVGKFKIPVVKEFAIFTKLGVNYLMTNFDKGDEGGGFKSRKNVYNIGLIFGAGVDWQVATNLIFNLEWLRFGGNPRFRNEQNVYAYQPDADAFMAGLRLRFDV